MKILCFNSTLDVGGAARQLSNLAAQLKKMGHDVTFLIYHNKKHHGDVLEEVNIPIVFIDEKNYLMRVLKIRKFIRSSSFDAVVSFLGPANFISICSGFPFRKWKVIVGERSADPKTMKSIRYFIFRFCHLFASAVVSNSHTNMGMVKKCIPFLPSSKCHVVYNMVDLDKWRSDINHVYKNDGYLKIVVPARYHESKNLNCFIDALQKLDCHDRKKIKVNWFGNIEIAESSRKIYESAKSKIIEYGLQDVIKLHLASNNIYKEIINADVVGLFSLYEGLPNAICEGMACGKPVLSTNVSDVSRLVRNNVNGFIIENTDSDSIYEGLKLALNVSVETLISMGNKSRETAEELFASSFITERYLKLLSKKNENKSTTCY